MTSKGRERGHRILNALVAHADAFTPDLLNEVVSVLTTDDGGIDYDHASAVAFARWRHEDRKATDAHNQRVNAQTSPEQTLDCLAADVSDAELARLSAMGQAAAASGYEQGALDTWNDANKTGIWCGIAVTVAAMDALNRQVLQEEGQWMAGGANWIIREKEDELDRARRVRAQLQGQGVLTEDTAPTEKATAHQVATGRPSSNTNWRSSI